MSLAPLWTILLALAVPMPVGTDRRSMRIPWTTLAIIAANVVVYLILRPESRPAFAGVFYAHYGLMPSAPAPASFLTSLFIHVSLLHLFWNMTFLLLFGGEVEDALGPAGSPRICATWESASSSPATGPTSWRSPSWAHRGRSRDCWRRTRSGSTVPGCAWSGCRDM
jgi:hypothetical protein